MKDQFATYEVSKQLKELGYDEKCFGHWTTGGASVRTEKTLFVEIFKNGITRSESNLTISPLWQQVEQWLWEKYKIWIEVNKDTNGEEYETYIRNPNYIQIGYFNSPK